MERIKSMPEDEAEHWLKSMADEKDSVSYRSVIRKHLKSIPDETPPELPSDLAENHDHYAYGTPKR
jgi:hypothetical protein